MVVNGRPIKRMKRRVTADLKDFLTFPSASDEFSGDFDGPFRSNILSFLKNYAQISPPVCLFPHLLVWQITFRIGNLKEDPDSIPAVVTLDVVEEDVPKSRSVYCDNCKVVGWSGHPVCAKRYHFIIRSGLYSSTDGYSKPCASCGDILQLPDSRCKSCNYVMTKDELEDWVYLQLGTTTHLLHGVVHSNGFGHLLRVNGKEGGSKLLSGCDIMNFWDRLCTTLRVRKISVMDVSRKYGLEYRLLHAITNGHPWYGGWGYEFGAGSFALTADTYKKSVENLSKIPLSLYYSESRKPRTRLHSVVSFYQSLSETQLLTLSDLFCFLLRLIRNADQQSPADTDKKPRNSSSWTKEDSEHVEQAMIKVLRAVGGDRWVSWRSLKGALHRIASSELLDYCLKDLGGKLVQEGMVYSRCNPDTDALEYRLNTSQDISEDMRSEIAKSPTKDHLLRDLKFLYASLLDPKTTVCDRPTRTSEIAKSSAAKLLDCKQFVKDHKPEKIDVVNPFAVRVLCEVELIDHPKDHAAPPPELILLASNATLADIKTEAAKAFQEVYLMFQRFKVEEVISPVTVTDPFKNESSSLIRVQGRCHGNLVHLFGTERGLDEWTVSCVCGATDDDGEGMLACDGCEVWQHTRCAGIHDSDAVPDQFICGRCANLLNSSLPTSGIYSCKDEIVSDDKSSRRDGKNLTAGVR
ncbi:PHD finger protein At1g33420-like [Papaver somniferum]|uniref:PHD finger protein At1g33420-like n=1 Tax=Papaver somniferum TaxID=3469 RepID=UPI000E704847|nr:PHD finger protein At1g33420-like [Papaver somniferum]